MTRGVWLGFVLGLGLVLACGSEVRVVGQHDDAGGGGSGHGGGSQGGSNQGGSGQGGTLPAYSLHKVDVLFMIDNSRRMADMQEILKLAVPDLLGSLTNPRCVQADGTPASTQPAGPLDPCPPDTTRQFQPVNDLHIGVITSSLGGLGADACDSVNIPSENDNGHLVARKSPEGPEQVPTWADKGFLAWDPAAQQVPPGEANIDNLIGSLAQMIGGAGQLGCGYESQLEAWYRFLIDPSPYQSIELQNSSAVPQGVDQVLLQQRKDFLRDDSNLVIVMLSDENDCSTRAGGQYYFARQIYAPGSGSNPYHLPKPRAACATDPASPCCRSCGQSPGDGCDSSQDNCAGALDAGADHINLRCFEQKRRFGIDFNWPLDRYQAGLQSAQITDSYGNVVANPLFAAGMRAAGNVRLAAIVGVPWQDIARRNASGKPDLLSGLDGDGKPAGGFQSAVELAESGTWALVAGDLDAYVPPTDPHMLESVEPRSGSNPVTGDAIAPPNAGEGANPINGHEYSNPMRDDLQYACIFLLKQPRDCTDPNLIACECLDPNSDSPLCDPSNKTIQKYAKAYPALRQLALLAKLKGQAAVGSACPEQQTDPALYNFGYRPAMGAIVEALVPLLPK